MSEATCCRIHPARGRGRSFHQRSYSVATRVNHKTPDSSDGGADHRGTSCTLADVVSATDATTTTAATFQRDRSEAAATISSGSTGRKSKQCARSEETSGKVSNTETRDFRLFSTTTTTTTTTTRTRRKPSSGILQPEASAKSILSNFTAASYRNVVLASDVVPSSSSSHDDDDDDGDGSSSVVAPPAGRTTPRRSPPRSAGFAKLDRTRAVLPLFTDVCKHNHSSPRSSPRCSPRSGRARASSRLTRSLNTDGYRQQRPHSTREPRGDVTRSGNQAASDDAIRRHHHHHQQQRRRRLDSSSPVKRVTFDDNVTFVRLRRHSSPLLDNLILSDVD